MNILIVYATNSSGTQSVSQLIAKQLRAAGHVVSIVRANEAKADQLRNHDLVILGSCTWEKVSGTERVEGQLQEHMAAFVEACNSLRFEQRFAVFGLGDSSYTNFCASVDHLERFVRNVGGELIVPSLRIDGYYFDQDNNDKLVTDWAGQLAKAF